MIGVDELRDHDLTKCTSSLFPEVRELLIAYPGRLVLAGGFPRAIVACESAADVDLFVAGRDVAVMIAEQLARNITHLGGNRGPVAGIESLR